MTSVGDVVAQLRDLIDQLDKAAIAATRAQAETRQAQALFAESARGTSHPRAQQATNESRTAGEKAGKIARLLAEALEHFTAYTNIIAPGAIPAQGPAVDAMPSGEQVVQESDKAANSFRRLSKKIAQNAESAGERAKGLTEFLEASRPSGTSSTTQPATPPPTRQTSAATPGDAVQALVITGAAVLAAALNAASLRKKRKEQRRD